MEAGALGLSCGIMYTPECFSKTEDFVFWQKYAASTAAISPVISGAKGIP